MIPKSESRRPARCAILTVGTGPEDDIDENGAVMRSLVEEFGHEVSSYRQVPDAPALIRKELGMLLSDGSLDALFVNGGTRLASRDATFEIVGLAIEKEIPGFAELFRSLFFQEVGPRAMLARAVAGFAGGKLVVSMPGTPEAIETAMRRLVLPEIGRILQLLGRSDSE